MIVILLATITNIAGCTGDAQPASAPRFPFHQAASPEPNTTPATFGVPPRTSVASTITRHDLVLGDDGIEAAFREAALSDALLDQLDSAFVERVDLFALAPQSTQLSLWVRDENLVAAKLALRRGDIFAAKYEGERAPRGFYDARGMSMTGALRARPVSLRRITSRFGARFDAFTGEQRTHRGIDYGVPRGTPVMSAGRGRVGAIGSSAAAGNFIKLIHADGYESFYLHLDAVDDALRVGSVVDQGAQIALSGNTGRSTGPHLHYELHLAGIPVDPLALLPMPKVALGPLARREHLAFMKNLEAIHDRRRDGDGGNFEAVR